MMNSLFPSPCLQMRKIGWICQRRDGKWVQIKRLCSLGGLPWICYEISGLRYINNGQQLNSKPSDADIIHTEPLAPEGTAEWAWQQMLLGNLIIHSEYSSKHHTWSMDNKGIACASHSGMFANCKEQWLRNAIGNGWQLYTPEAKQDLTDAPFEGLDSVKEWDSVLFSDGIIRDVLEIKGTYHGNKIYPPAIMVCYQDILRCFNICDGKHMATLLPIRAIRIATPLDIKLYGEEI